MNKIFYGNGQEIVWNPNKNCRLCKFTDGKFETNDDEVIQTLELLGYEKFETDIIKEQEIKTSEIKNKKKIR